VTPDYFNIADIAENAFCFSNKLANSIIKENNITYEKLNQRYGKDWKVKFNSEIDLIRHLLDKVEYIIRKEPYIINKNKDLEKNGDGLNYDIYSLTSNIFSVKAYSWGTWNGQNRLLIYYKITIDLSR